MTQTSMFSSGCTALLGNVQDDGSIKFNRGMDMYNYDGRDFLLFDDGNGVWVASVEPVVTTKRKWDGVLVLKEYTKGYLENECIKWLTEFLDYGQKHLKEVSKPEVFLYTTKSKVKSNVVLNCLPTSFYPKDIIVQIKQNDHVLSKLDGLETSDVRPNEDDTFQRRDHVKILKSDVSTYSCQIIHKTSEIDIEKVWAGGSNTAIIIGAVIAALVLVGVLVLVVSKITGKIGNPTNDLHAPLNRSSDDLKDGKGSEGSLNSSDSGVSSSGRESQTPEAASLLHNTESG